ncbi:TauD/TfdA family dioxygenase [Nonomuraea glycinis]|uniref:TauD/TfdA family dioxygenase n=1 Tax=Nonomuraea glycinis TaxID=2047744 RepID=UPI002E12F19F|nr:TauD/TfdA family dioxygenase [Nonomuraea glycinis]
MRLKAPNGQEFRIDQAQDGLAQHGIILFSGATLNELKSALNDWTVPYRHPHDISPGVTVIRPNLTGEANAKGFTYEALPLHTDRAQVDNQPTIIGCLYTQEAADGGESLLLDGAEIACSLLRRNLLAMADNVVLLSKGNRWRAVIEPYDSYAGFRIRYRNDSIARPHVATCDARPLLDAFEAKVASPLIYAFKSGEGYLIHNHRVLHGRYAFTGDRSAVRILANVAESSGSRSLNHGFTLRGYSPAAKGED